MRQHWHSFRAKLHLYEPAELLTPIKIRTKMSRHYFERIFEDEGLPCNMRDRAGGMVTFVCAELSLSPVPKVVWIRPLTEDAAREILKHWRQTFEGGIPPPGSIPPVRELQMDITQGFTADVQTDEIWIRSDLSDFPALEFITAHETRNIWQNQPQNRPRYVDRCTAEGDAYPYGYDAVKRYVAATLDEKVKSAQAVFLREWPDAGSKWLTFDR